MAGATPTQTWEYRSLDAVAPTASTDLAALGRAGWEVVGALDVRGVPTLFLKRPEPDFRERVTLEQRRGVYAARALPPPTTDGTGA